MMFGNLQKLISVFLVGALMLVSEVEPGETQDDQSAQIGCLGEMIELSDEMKIALNKCKEEFGNNTDSLCYDICFFRKAGILADASKPKFDLTILEKWINDKFPKAAQEGMKSDMKKCFEAETKPLTDDDDCKSHADYNECFMKSIGDNCWEEDEE